MNKFNTVAFSILSLPLTMHAAGVSAQAARPTLELEEVVVTAQKREQAITDVGMSINAISGDDLRDLGISSAADLSKVVPALNIQPPGRNITGAPVYTMRGIGFNEKSLAALSAVSFYVDEIPLPYVWMTAGPTLDVSRVEVLKGPQGTLYGQNSTGGAINYIANKPSDAFQAGFEAGYGRFNRVDLSGYLSGPLTDRVKARVAARSIQADGWQTSKSRPSDKLGKTDSIAGRLLLDFAATDSLDFELSLNGWKDRSESPGVQIIGFNPVVRAILLATPSPYPYFAAYITNAILNPSDNRLTDWSAGIDYKNDNKFTQLALRANWRLSDSITLTSISTASQFDYRTYHDVDASPAPLNSYDASGSIDAFSQELRLSGESGDRLNWILGANYSDDDIFDLASSYLEGTTLGFATGGTTGTVGHADSDRTSKAGFANVDYKIAPALTLTAGVRYTEIDLTFSGCASDNGNGTVSRLLTGGTLYTGRCVTRLLLAPPNTFGLVSNTLPEDNVSWRVGLDWKPGDDSLLYGNVGRGYKSGNFPNVIATLDAQYTPVKQEQVTAYEVGYKGTLWNNRLQLNAALFHMDYIDKQLFASRFLPLTGATAEQTVNVPDSDVNGAELEVVLRPIAGMTLRSGAGYTDTEIKVSPSGVYFINTSATLPLAPVFVSQAPGDLTGQPFNLAPKWHLNFDGAYEWMINGALGAFAGGTVTYQSSTLPSVGAAEQMRIPSYATVDLRAGIEAADGKWRFTVWGRNVSNKFYTESTTRVFDVAIRWTGMPATYGATVAYQFN